MLLPLRRRALEGRPMHEGRPVPRAADCADGGLPRRPCCHCCATMLLPLMPLLPLPPLPQAFMSCLPEDARIQVDFNVSVFVGTRCHGPSVSQLLHYSLTHTPPPPLPSAEVGRFP